ncbi:MAG: ribonuclease R [Anaerohalosphaera sp.]|nr:ribonuclease R [Anaerohalosphaera sp.]
MTEAYKKQILRFMSKRDYSPVRVKDIAHALSIPDGQYDSFKAAFDDLCESGQIVIGSGGIAKFPKMTNQVTGTFRANAKGFGFVIPLSPNSYGDLFIPPEHVAGAMSGDIVVARSFRQGMRQGETRYTGVIEKILERTVSRVVGTLTKAGKRWMVRPDGKELVDPIVVEDVGAKGAKKDDKVVVDIVLYPTFTELARGAIVEVLGRSGVYDAEIKSIIYQYDLPVEFEEDCIDQAREAAASFSADNAEGRDDISETVVATIDPPDAKDFDDAISLSKNKDGNWVLGVHIADVSTFIPMDSALDIEAKERGNSIYLPGKVIPMLPEILSNGICSLQPGQKRLAKSAYITYDEQGNILGTTFENSIICSSARLTYEDADNILKGDTGSFDSEIVTLVKNMDKLARAIEKRRFKKGMLHLDLPETELVFDEDGNVIDAHPADDCYPHTIIEMFMVEANEAVASLLDRFNVPFMRRIHPDPEPAKSKEMGRFVKICGFKLPRKMDRFALQDILKTAKGTSYSYAINTHVLRSLQRAEYSPMHIGHFALASTHYCHFTSPIRRYADLMVHRLLQCYVTGKLKMIGLEEVIPDSVLSEIGTNITAAEQKAAEAERELKTVLLLEMLSSRIGEELNCVVSGLTSFGVFVQCIKFGVEGLIEFDDLGVDHWKFDEHSQAVVGKNSGKTVHLGQEMTVKIVSVNIPARRLELVPSEPLVTSRHRIKEVRSRRKTAKKQNSRKSRSRKRR